MTPPFSVCCVAQIRSEHGCQLDDDKRGAEGDQRARGRRREGDARSGIGTHPTEQQLPEISRGSPPRAAETQATWRLTPNLAADAKPPPAASLPPFPSLSPLPLARSTQAGPRSTQAGPRCDRATSPPSALQVEEREAAVCQQREEAAAAKLAGEKREKELEAPPPV